jgi:hypothetical protein
MNKEIDVYKNYLKNLEELYLNNSIYPMKTRVLGFNTLMVYSRDEFYGMIQMLKDIIKRIEAKGDE